MLISAADAVPAFLEVARVKETLAAYCLQGEVVPASLDDIEYAICQEYDAAVEKKTIPFKSDLVRGMIRIHGPRHGKSIFAQTIIDSELSRSMTRFVQAKELCHVMLFHQENCTTDPTQIIAYFVQEVVLVATGEARDLKNEKLADLAAMELLFPHSLRADAARRIAAKEDDVASIASWLVIPEHVVEQVLDPIYMDFADAVWGQVNLRTAA